MVISAWMAVATSGPQPRATLVATEAGLKLSSTLGDFNLGRTAIQCVKRAGLYPWLWAGLRIYHTVPGYPQRLQFCPTAIRSRQLLAQLNALGFKTA